MEKKIEKPKRRRTRKYSSDALERSDDRRNRKAHSVVANRGGAGNSTGLRNAGRSLRTDTKSAARSSSARTGDVVRPRSKTSRDKATGNDQPLPKRNRMHKSTSAKLRKALNQMSLVHSHLQMTVRAFSSPTTKRTDSFAKRAAAGDLTLLHDCVTKSILNLEKLAKKLDRAIEPKPTQLNPGSDAKVEVFAERYAAGYRLFAEGDKRTE